MRLSSFDEVERVLQPYIAAATAVAGRDITTERTFELAGLVDNPQKKLRVIHIAGTSGKTSTSYFMAGLLKESGSRVGLTVSPHITSIAERVQINGQPLEEAKFCDYMTDFLPIVTPDSENLPSYFELMMVFAFWVFAKEGIDYAVIETGLGGLHDSSNICRRPDKLCLITDIGLDHLHVLGDSLPAIATQKAGIIAQGNHVIMHDQEDDIKNTIQHSAKAAAAELEILPPNEYNNYQDRNFALALAGYRYLAERDKLENLTSAQLARVRAIQVPGRMQLQYISLSEVMYDGAHNEQKMSALVHTLRTAFADRKWAVVFAMKGNKDYEAGIAMLAELAHRAVVAPIHSNTGIEKLSVANEVLITEFEQHHVPCTGQPSVKEALDVLVAANEPYILVTGSLYAIAELMNSDDSGRPHPDAVESSSIARL